MATPRTPAFTGSTMRRLAWAWLLPLLLLLGQHGHFLHEVDHLGQAAAGESRKHRPADADRCGLCLAYGHLAEAAAPGATLPGLRSDLREHHAADRRHASAERALPAARNRGPPAA